MAVAAVAAAATVVCRNSRRRDSRSDVSRVPGTFFIYFYTIVMFSYYSTDEEPKKGPRDVMNISWATFTMTANEDHLAYIFFPSFVLINISFKLELLLTTTTISTSTGRSWQQQHHHPTKCNEDSLRKQKKKRLKRCDKHLLGYRMGPETRLGPLV